MISDPPYHLRTQKMVDRFLLVETLRLLREYCDINISKYTYYGFGGPFLEDFKLLHTYLPELNMVSIEADLNTFQRQEFHRFTSKLDLRNMEFSAFLDSHENKENEIFWLDYTDLRVAQFYEITRLLKKCLPGTILKITMRARLEKYAFANVESFRHLESTLDSDIDSVFVIETDENDDFYEFFHDEFSEFLPSDENEVQSHLIPGKFPTLIQKMLQMACDRALSDLTFQPLTSVRYQEPTPILTVTGVVCTSEESKKLQKQLLTWKFQTLNWEKPIKIFVPDLSLKERLHLEKHLPLNSDSCDLLIDEMKYSLTKQARDHKKLISQYADFHRYYPVLTKVLPY